MVKRTKKEAVELVEAVKADVQGGVANIAEAANEEVGTVSIRRWKVILAAAVVTLALIVVIL